MDRQNLDRFYADNVGLIHTVTHKSFGRLRAIGAATDYEDLYQELTEVFIKAYDRFDESLGNKFSTYFITSAFHEVNKIAKRFEVERIEFGVKSFEELSVGLDGGSVEEMIADSASTPEQELAGKDAVRNMLEKLSPLASMIAGMAIDPPDFMEHEFAAAQAHAEYSRSLGVEKRARGSLNVAFVCSVLEKTTDLPPGAIKSAKNEVFAFAERNVK